MIVVVVINVYISICRSIMTMALAAVLGLGQSDVDSLVLVAVDIDLADGGTEVAVAQGEVDIAQGDALDHHVVALTEIDVLRAVTLIGAAVAQRIVVEPAVDDIHLVVGGLCALSVHGSLATDGDVLLSEGEDERLPVDHGTLVVVPGIGRAQQFGAVFEHQRDIRLQIDGARKVTARRKHQVAASVAAHVVDGMLDDVGVERYAVGFGSEVGNAIVPGVGCDAQECAEHTEQTFSNSSHVVDSYVSRRNMAASGDC